MVLPNVVEEGEPVGERVDHLHPFQEALSVPVELQDGVSILVGQQPCQGLPRPL